MLTQHNYMHEQITWKHTVALKELDRPSRKQAINQSNQSTLTSHRQKLIQYYNELSNKMEQLNNITGDTKMTRHSWT